MAAIIRGDHVAGGVFQWRGGFFFWLLPGVLRALLWHRLVNCTCCYRRSHATWGRCKIQFGYAQEISNNFPKIQFERSNAPPTTPNRRNNKQQRQQARNIIEWMPNVGGAKESAIGGRERETARRHVRGKCESGLSSAA